MKTTYYFWIGNLLLAAILTLYAYWEQSNWFWMAFTLAWMILWGLSQLLDNSYTPGIFSFVFTGVCLVGTFLGLRSVLLFLGMTAALNAWDADRFYRRWKDTLEREANNPLERRHIFRLLMVDGVAISVAILGLTIKTQLSFGLMLLIVVIALISLSQLVRLLRNPGPKA
jgi:hypothetical protein